MLAVFALGLLVGYVLAGALPWGPGGGAQRMQLATELATARQVLARTERLAQVDQRAAQQVQTELVRTEARRADLARQLAIYQRVLEPGRADGLAVDDVAVFNADADGALHYRVLLTQGANGGQAAQGTLALSVRGPRAGKAAEQVVVRAPYRFHYLHVMEGPLPVPDGWVPDELAVTLRPAGRGAPVTRVLRWQGVYEAPVGTDEVRNDS